MICIYKIFNPTNGELLYVGMTQDPFGRFSSHKYAKFKGVDFCMLVVGRYDNWQEAMAHEDTAIWLEQPKYNIYHKKVASFRVQD